MKNRICSIEFSRHILRDGYLNVASFIKFMQQLPKNSNIVGFQEFSHKDCAGILIESVDFKEVNSGEVIPTVDVIFKEDNNVDVSVSIDFSPVLDYSQLPKRLYADPGVNGIEFNKKGSIEKRKGYDLIVDSNQYWYTPSFNTEYLASYQTEINRIAEEIYRNQAIFAQNQLKLKYDLPAPSEEAGENEYNKYEDEKKLSEYSRGVSGQVLTSNGWMSPDSIKEIEQGPPCDHTMIPYEGLTLNYNYCSKCDFKDNG